MVDQTFSKAFLRNIANNLMQNLEVKDRSYHFKTYHKCFVGKECVAYLMKYSVYFIQVASNIQQALEIGNALIENNYFHHVCRDHPLRNKKLFYRFFQHESHGAPSENPQDSWLSVLNKGQNEEQKIPFIKFKIKDVQDNHLIVINRQNFPDNFSNLLELNPEISQILLDYYNAILLNNVRPPGWVNPVPQIRYSMISIGAGAGGLITACGAANLGAKSAIIQKAMLGGDCLNVGCVPSKSLIKASRIVNSIRRCRQFGVQIQSIKVDFPKIMENMRKKRAQISYNDSCKRYADKFGVDVFIGKAEFIKSNTLRVNDQQLKFSKCCIATGGRPRVIQIEGLETVPYYTSDTIFNLTELPQKMVFIGSGPISCELGQAFSRFGSLVTIICRSQNLLPKQDKQAVSYVTQALKQDGLSIFNNSRLKKVVFLQQIGNFPLISCELQDGSLIETNCLVLAVGRQPNVEGMGLENARVNFNQKGIKINQKCRTSNKKIYAVGDCCQKLEFTHMADAMARIVLKNGLFGRNSKIRKLVVPWCIYTDPQLAHVGKHEHLLKAKGVKYKKVVKTLEDNDRGIVDGETLGFVKVLMKKKSDEIIGATVVGPRAGDIIGQMAMAIKHGIGLSRFQSVIYPYPTYAEDIRQAGDIHYFEKLTPRKKTLMRMVIKQPLN